MNGQATKLQAVENDLKQLMADPGDGKGSGGRGEPRPRSPQRRQDPRLVVFELVIMILDGSASVSRRADISQRMQGRMDVFPALQPTVVAVGTALP